MTAASLEYTLEDYNKKRRSVDQQRVNHSCFIFYKHLYNEDWVKVVEGISPEC